LLKTAITNNILSKPNEGNSTIITKIVEPKAASLIDSSNLLVTQLGEYAKNESQTLIFLETIFAVANIAFSVVILYLVVRILKPIFDLNKAMLRVKKGNLEVLVKQRKGNDELSTLTESFNSMVDSIRNYIITQNDLTGKLKESYDQIEQTQKMQKEIIDVAAHELRAPIQPILGLSQLLRSKKRANSEHDDELLDIIVRNASRLQHLTEDILDVSRIESHLMQLRKEVFNLNKAISKTVEDYTIQIQDVSSNVKLLYDSRVEDDNDDLVIEADKHRIIQVIYNLLSNSFKFTQEGIILVTTRKDNTNSGNQVIVSVKDTGTGIGPEILPRLFTKFATKSNRGGADSNNQTGWNGIDYISEIAFDNNTRNWKNTVGAVSDVGYRLLETKNFTGFDKSGGGMYLFLSLNLSAMNFPEQYRIIFLEKDPIINKYTHTRFPVVDYVNAIHIPSPKFIMSSSSNSVELIPGDKKIIEIRLKSINPSTIANVQPQINFYPKNEPQGIRLSFQPNKTYLFPEGSSSELTIDPLQTLIPRTYTIPVFAKVTLPSEFFGNPTASMIVNSNLTATAIDWSQRIQQLAPSWNPVISFIAAIVALITGAVGFIIGKKGKKAKLTEWATDIRRSLEAADIKSWDRYRAFYFLSLFFEENSYYYTMSRHNRSIY
jgi:signal transduction histidine kinase